MILNISESRTIILGALNFWFSYFISDIRLLTGGGLPWAVKKIKNPAKVSLCDFCICDFFAKSWVNGPVNIKKAEKNGNIYINFTSSLPLHWIWLGLGGACHKKLWLWQSRPFMETWLFPSRLERGCGSLDLNSSMPLEDTKIKIWSAFTVYESWVSSDNACSIEIWQNNTNAPMIAWDGVDTLTPILSIFLK